MVQQFCATTGAQERTILAAYGADARLNLRLLRLRQGRSTIIPEDGDVDEEHLLPHKRTQVQALISDSVRKRLPHARG